MTAHHTLLNHPPYRAGGGRAGSSLLVRVVATPITSIWLKEVFAKAHQYELPCTVFQSEQRRLTIADSLSRVGRARHPAVAIHNDLTLMEAVARGLAYHDPQIAE